MDEDKERQLKIKIMSLDNEIYELQNEIKNLKKHMSSIEDWLQEVHIGLNEHKDYVEAHDYDALNPSIQSELEERIDDIERDVRKIKSN